MFTRILIAWAVGIGLLLGGIAVVATPAILWAAVACGAIAGALGLLRVRRNAPGDAAVETRAARRAGLVAGIGGAGGCLALAGLALLLGAAAGPILLGALVVGVAWWARRRSSTSTAPRSGPWRVERVSAPDAARPDDPPRAPMPWSVPDPTDLSTPQLCLVWQHTYFLLLELPAGASREPVAHLREQLLDEMERRDRDGFTRWLDAGARAGSDPARYLGGDR